MCRFLGLRPRLRAQREVATNLSWVGSPTSKYGDPYVQAFGPAGPVASKA